MNEIVHGVHRAAGGGGRDNRKQCRADDAETDLLALHVSAGEAERIERIIAVCFGCIAGDDPADEKNAHDGEYGPALTLVADHAAEDICQRSADRED